MELSKICSRELSHSLSHLAFTHRKKKTYQNFSHRLFAPLRTFWQPFFSPPAQAEKAKSESLQALNIFAGC
jgi:hypothetical protein